MRPVWRMENSTMTESSEPFNLVPSLKVLSCCCTLPLPSPPLPHYSVIPSPPLPSSPLLCRFHKGQHIMLESVEHGQECGVITTISLNEVSSCAPTLLCVLVCAPSCCVCVCLCTHPAVCACLCTHPAVCACLCTTLLCVRVCAPTLLCVHVCAPPCCVCVSVHPPCCVCMSVHPPCCVCMSVHHPAVCACLCSTLRCVRVSVHHPAVCACLCMHLCSSQTRLALSPQIWIACLPDHSKLRVNLSHLKTGKYILKRRSA